MATEIYMFRFEPKTYPISITQSVNNCQFHWHCELQKISKTHHKFSFGSLPLSFFFVADAAGVLLVVVMPFICATFDDDDKTSIFLLCFATSLWIDYFEGGSSCNTNFFLSYNNHSVLLHKLSTFSECAMI